MMLTFQVDLSLDLVPSLISISFASDDFLCVQNLDVAELKLDFESQNLIL